MAIRAREAATPSEWGTEKVPRARRKGTTYLLRTSSEHPRGRCSSEAMARWRAAVVAGRLLSAEIGAVACPECQE
jgi:hypothetical protein